MIAIRDWKFVLKRFKKWLENFLRDKLTCVVVRISAIIDIDNIGKIDYLIRNIPSDRQTFILALAKNKYNEGTTTTKKKMLKFFSLSLEFEFHFLFRCTFHSVSSCSMSILFRHDSRGFFLFVFDTCMFFIILFFHSSYHRRA